MKKSKKKIKPLFKESTIDLFISIFIAIFVISFIGFLECNRDSDSSDLNSSNWQRSDNINGEQAVDCLNCSGEGEQEEIDAAAREKALLQEVYDSDEYEQDMCLCHGYGSSNPFSEFHLHLCPCPAEEEQQ